MDIKRIAPEEVKELLESNTGYVYLDVRTEPEFDAGVVEQRSIRRDIVMHGPLASFKVIPGSFAGRDIVAGQPEDLAARSLQVVPDHLAIAAEELVPFNLHINSAMVNLC